MNTSLFHISEALIEESPVKELVQKKSGNRYESSLLFETSNLLDLSDYHQVAELHDFAVELRND